MNQSVEDSSGDELAEQVAADTHAHACSIFLVRRRGAEGTLEFFGGHGWDDLARSRAGTLVEIDYAAFPEGDVVEGFTRYCAMASSPIATANVDNPVQAVFQERTVQVVRAGLGCEILGSDAGAFAAHPIVARSGALLGVVRIINRRDEAAFEQTQIATLARWAKCLAPTAGLALRSMNALSRVGALFSAGTVRQLVHAYLHCACELSGASENDSAVYLADPMPSGNDDVATPGRYSFVGPGEAASTRFQLSYGVDEAGCDLVATMLGAQAASPGKRVSVRRKAPQRLQSLWSNNLPADMQTSSQLQQLRLEANQAGHGAGSVIALRIAGETGFTHGAAVLASPRLGAFTNQDFNNAAIVTEQFARAYEQMRRNQSWVSTFATTSPWAATAVNRKGKLLFSNAAAAAKLGVPQIAFGTQLTGSDTIDVVEAIYGGDKALAKHIRQELLRSERGCAGRDARPGVDFGPPSGPSEPLYTYLTPRASAREGSPHDHKLAVRLWPHLLRDPNSGEESGSIGFFEDLGTDAAQVLRYFGDQRRGRTVHLPLIAELERARQPKRITVIRGERGTGRALMAQEVHRHRKCAGPLLSVTPRPDGYFLAASNRVLSLEDLATEARGGTLHFERLLDILPVTQLRIATQIESRD